MRLGTEELERLITYAASARWPAGFTLYQRGAPADGLFVVLRGCVVLRTRLRSGRAFVPRLVGAGEVFGAEGLRVGATFETDARAEWETETLHFSRARVATLVRERPRETLALMAQVSEAHALLLERLRELAMMNVEQRLRAAVDRARLARADLAPDGPLTFDAAGYRLLCEMVGATRESVSLVVNRLVAQGMAERDGAAIVISPATRQGDGGARRGDRQPRAA
ncbi:MAG TPA: Crp/Fnr family transcriptional regulator, partial [Gemmatimonadaceae bacterium]|nr:Crp/Fnr family transcriptional regulator [Gemmatimonadaceae bacterium]